MKSKKTFSILAVCLLTVLLAMAVIFLMASAPPADYRPFEFNHQKQKEVVHRLVANHVTPFLNKFGEVGPFTMEIDEKELNCYLASLDTIAYQRMGSGKEKTGSVYSAMDEAGLAGPFIKFRDGYLTFMMRTKAANKVISADLAFDVNEKGEMVVDLRQIRVGRMPIPQGLVDGYIDQLQESVRDLLAEEQVSDLALATNGLELLLARIIMALDGQSFPTDLTIRKQTKHTHRIDIADGKLTLQVTPTVRE